MSKPTPGRDPCPPLPQLQDYPKILEYMADEWRRDKIGSYGTWQNYRTAIRSFATFLSASGIDNPQNATADDLKLLVESLDDHHNGFTGGKYWTRIRDCYIDAYGVDTAIVEANHKASKILPSKGETEVNNHIGPDSGRYAPTITEIETMLRHTHHVSEGEGTTARDRLCVLLLPLAGLRVEEAAHIQLDDIIWEEQCIRIRVSKSDAGRRAAPMPPALEDAIYDYLAGPRDDLLGGDSEENPWLLPPHHASGHDGHISGDTVSEIISDAAAEAGIQEKLYTDAAGRDRRKIKAHGLRGTFASELNDNDVPVRMISRLMGHVVDSSQEGSEHTPTYIQERGDSDEEIEIDPELIGTAIRNLPTIGL